MKNNKWMLPAVMGGLGGALNALFCLIKFPAAIPGSEDVLHWHILLAGFIHGAVLTVVALRAAHCLLSQTVGVRWAGGILGAGYIAGWISYIPLRISINSNQTFKEILSAFWWPFSNGLDFDILWSPLMTFGAVTALYTFFLIRLAARGSQTALSHIGTAAISGVVGSLWWWNAFERPYFCLLHGALWGIFAGFGAWKSGALPAK